MGPGQNFHRCGLCLIFDDAILLLVYCHFVDRISHDFPELPV
jgi:hypothetical protein